MYSSCGFIIELMLHAINYIYYISTCRVLLKGRTKDFETDMTTCVDNDNDSPIYKCTPVVGLSLNV
jgi:hypothetical protein